MEGEMSEPYRLVEQEIPRLRRYARALTRSGDRADATPSCPPRIETK
jgi:DNA-directed RNA polymerase specialized sigma24 family protein